MLLVTQLQSSDCSAKARLYKYYTFPAIASFCCKDCGKYMYARAPVPYPQVWWYLTPLASTPTIFSGGGPGALGCMQWNFHVFPVAEVTSGRTIPRCNKQERTIPSDQQPPELPTALAHIYIHTHTPAQALQKSAAWRCAMSGCPQPNPLFNPPTPKTPSPLMPNSEVQIGINHIWPNAWPPNSPSPFQGCTSPRTAPSKLSPHTITTTRAG